MKYTPAQEDIERGASNLLLNCARARPGDSILLVGEKCADPYYEEGLCHDVAEVAVRLQMHPQVIFESPVSKLEEASQRVLRAMENADQTIFFSRLGDQARFFDLPGTRKHVVSTTITRKHLASAFAVMDFRGLKRVHDRLVEVIAAAKTYSISDNNGTALTGEISGLSTNRSFTEFTVEYFPTMILPPINCLRLNGTLVLDHFLMSTSTRTYEDSVYWLESPVSATIKDSRIVAMAGNSKVVDDIRNQFVRAAKLTGGDPYTINSWHTGINPNTFFDGDPRTQIEKWGSVAYGSPRYTHFHVAGNDPGDSSIQLFDATIAFDEEIMWKAGQFVFLERADVQTYLCDADRNLLPATMDNDIGIRKC